MLVGQGCRRESWWGCGKARSLSGPCPLTRNWKGPTLELGAARAGEGLTSTCLGAGEASAGGERCISSLPLQPPLTGLPALSLLGCSLMKQPLPQVFSTYPTRTTIVQLRTWIPWQPLLSTSWRSGVGEVGAVPVELEKGGSWATGPLPANFHPWGTPVASH